MNKLKKKFNCTIQISDKGLSKQRVFCILSPEVSRCDMLLFLKEHHKLEQNNILLSKLYFFTINKRAPKMNWRGRSWNGCYQAVVRVISARHVHPHTLSHHGVVRLLYLLFKESGQYLHSSWVSRTLFPFPERVHSAPWIFPGASLIKHVSSPQGRAIHRSAYNLLVSENNLSNDMIHIYRVLPLLFQMSP